MKETVIKQKQVSLNGKTYTEKLTQEMIDEVRSRADIWKLNGWMDVKSFVEHLSFPIRKYWAEDAMSIFREASPVLAVGMGATLNLYSDSRAMTITDVISPKEIVVSENETKCIDYFAGSYEILEGLKNYMYKSTFTLRRNGTWVEKGARKETGCVTLTVGFRRHYIDPSF